MKKTLYQSVSLTLFLFILLGGVYPLVTTVVGQWLFATQANGSLIYINQTAIGSKLIGQKFAKAQYFHSRPSINDYSAANSSASNLAPTNKILFDKIEKYIQKILSENPGTKTSDIPIDLVTNSASGLDPDISVESAYLQIPRVAKVRSIKENDIKSLVDKNVHMPSLGFIGVKTVNVLELNLSLDSINPKL